MIKAKCPRRPLVTPSELDADPTQTGGPGGDTRKIVKTLLSESFASYLH